MSEREPHPVFQYSDPPAGSKTFYMNTAGEVASLGQRGTQGVRATTGPRTVRRYEVPVSGEAHSVRLYGQVLHAAAGRPGYMQFWALDEGGTGVERKFRVFFSGERLPAPPVRLGYWGTGVDGAFVGHLFELIEPMVFGLAAQVGEGS